MADPVVIAQSGHKALLELRKVLAREEIPAEIVRPPDSNPNT